MAKSFQAVNIMEGFNPGNLIVDVGENKADKTARAFGAELEKTTANYSAWTAQLEPFVYLVCVPKNTAREDWRTLAIIAAHEATHVMQFYLRDIGELEPGDEFQAYLVQSATQAILDEVKKWRKKSKTPKSKSDSKTD